MSILMYKQRHQSPNKKSTAAANYGHIRYIATRPRVIANENMNHGLFGKLAVGDVVDFENWQDVAKLVYRNSKDGIIMYRSIISFSAETADELLLSDQKSWQRYIEKHIGTLAEKNKIKRENFAFVCAIHNEKSHPHAHIAFWDKSEKIRSGFTSPKIPGEIRKQLIKDSFKEKILALSKEKDFASTAMRTVTNEMVDDFEKEFKLMKSKAYAKAKAYYGNCENELEYGFNFTDKLLNGAADKAFRIKNILPQKGRISYQLLPKDVKIEVDNLVKFLLANNLDLKNLVEEYVAAKMNVANLYGGTDEYLEARKLIYQQEAERIIANSALKMVKALNSKDYEEMKLAKDVSRQEFLVTQMMFSAMDILRSGTNNANAKFAATKNSNSNISKDAAKELYLKYQDKGYEH